MATLRLTRLQREERRREADELLRAGTLRPAAIARQLGVSRSAVSLWAAQLGVGGRGRAGGRRPAKLTAEQRRQWRALPYVDADAPSWRRLAAAVLLDGYCVADEEFICSRWARELADLLGLPEWPPAARYTFGQLKGRLRGGPKFEPEPAIGPIHSRNPRDYVAPWAGGPPGEDGHVRAAPADDYGDWRDLDDAGEALRAFLAMLQPGARVLELVE